MIGFSYFLVHLLALILPGVLVARLLNIRASNTIFIPASGYIFYIVLAALSKQFDWSLETFLTSYLGAFVMLALLSFRYGQNLIKPPDRYWALGFIVVVTSYSAYRLMVGPYTELPADLYRHLEFARHQLDAINSGHLGIQQSLAALLSQKGEIWYSFFALVSFLTGLEYYQTLAWASFANGLVFLCAVYSFSWYLFSHLDLDQNEKWLASVLSTFFLAAHLGLNIFAYIRYYSLAPTMLNMVIYFAAIIAILELLKWKSRQFRLIVFILLCLFSTAVVHTQEALFILVAGGMMLAWFALYSQPAARYPDPVFSGKRPLFYQLALVGLAIGFVVLELWAYTHIERPEKFANKITQLSQQGPVLNRILFLNPAYQAIQVITVWGLFVYALFIVYWRKFIAHPYLFAGMLIPFLTVFNPVFVDWFMRMDGVHTLWRMLFIVPLHFVAGLLVVYLYDSGRNAKSFARRSVSFLAIGALFTLLLPLSFNSNSRLTLASTDQNESYEYWQDLIEYLNQEDIDTTSILTDPVTGYMLSGLTKHRTYQYKFFNISTLKFNFESYADAPLKKYKGWLLVINDRNGGHSETGVRSRHWPGHVLNTSHFYASSLRDHIKHNRTSRFRTLWESEDIHVYLIQ